ncbi:MAG: hypothetical protein GY913_13780 [Proteobacteria bacterium]|nr:hypothetical protein [Pseudomonadota bacterium]MCP4917978.1 hypothetical protein [Pseudomonadota bacterium]
MTLLLALACTKTTGEDSGGIPLTGSDSDAVECFGSDPVVSNVTTENGGNQDFEGELFPTVLIWADVADEDGNLDFVTMDLWWDEEPDGAVDSSGDPQGSSSFVPNSDASPCAQTAETVGLYLQVGGGIPYDTQMDFAVRITDSENEVSNVGVATGFTPTETGDDGGAE